MFKKTIMLLFCIASLGLSNENESLGKYEVRLDDVTITSTGFETSVEEENKNTFIMPKKDIEKKNYKNVGEVLKDTPNVSIIDAGFGSMVDMRGQGDKASSKVKVLVDGIPMNVLDTSHSVTPVNTLSTPNIERIEIIPGGGAVLYGNGTSGGVVNIITNSNLRVYKNTGYISGKYGSYNSGNINLGSNLRITDNISFNINYTRLDEEGYRDLDEVQYDYVNAGINYIINDNNTISFKASYYKDDSTSTNALTKVKLDQDRKQRGVNLTEGGTKKNEYVGTYNLKLNDSLSLTTVAFYQKTNNEYLTTYPTYKQASVFEDEKTGINLKGKYGYSNGELIVGYEFLKNEMVRNSSGFVSSNNNLKKDTNSVFFLERHNITEKLQLIGGYRHEWADYDVNRNDGRTKLEDTKSLSNNAYEIGTNYFYSGTGNVYTRFEKGYISPSPTQLTDKTVLGYELNNLKSEDSQTFEIGVKDKVLGSYVSAAVFYTRTDDEITQNLKSGSGPMTWNFYNLDQTRRIGAELFMEQYFDKLTINESITYIDAKITKGTKDGDRIPYVSKVKATIGADYDFMDNLSASTKLNYYSDAEDTYKNEIENYMTVDLGVNYKMENGLSLNAGVNNLFNEKYNSYQNGNAYTPAQERNYFVGVKYEF